MTMKSPEWTSFGLVNIVLRDDDWVECLEMVSFVSKTLENHESITQIKTESIVELFVGSAGKSTSPKIDLR
ncbi:unnamed protein product [Cuscuta campestris]|uniref:Uncharacterized protein n=1 Tax=Cuscuta campestris TaxID=132261 RepID=A0A484KBM7_9ASTE|nr:unnamed protein product [Cuscuta campestris]